MYATFKLLQRDAKLNYLAWEWQDLVEGHIVQLTNNADQSRTFAWVGMHAAEAVHPRRHGAGGLPGAGPVPAVDAVGGQGRQRDSVSDRSTRTRSTAWACTGTVAGIGRAPVLRPRRQSAPNRRCVPSASGGMVVSLSSAGLRAGVDRVREPGRSVHDELSRSAAVTESTYKSQFGADLPARVYSATLGTSRFSMTVVDYRSIEKMLTEKAKSCPAGRGDVPRRGQSGSSTGAGYWKADYAGALIYATWQFMQRDGTVTEFIWNNIDLVEGHLLHLTNRTSHEPTRQSSCTQTGSTSARPPCPPAIRSRGCSSRHSAGSTQNGNSIRYQTLYHTANRFHNADVNERRPVEARHSIRLTGTGGASAVPSCAPSR